MKKNATPKLDAAWWNDSAPKALSGLGPLVKALRVHAKAAEAHRADATDKTQQAVIGSLDGVEESADNLSDEIEKLLKRGSKAGGSPVDPDDLAHTSQALKKFSKVIATTRVAATKAGHGADNTDHDSLLTDEEAYGDYLRTQLRRLKIIPLNFAFASGDPAESSRLLFHRSKSGKKLMLILRKATGIKRATWGIAKPHPEKKGVILLELWGKQLPGIKLRAMKLLKAFKPLPYSKVAIVVGEDEVDDISDEG